MKNSRFDDFFSSDSKKSQFEDFFSPAPKRYDIGEIIAHKKQVIENRRWLKRLVVSLVLIAVAVFVLLGLIFGIARIKGASMVPTYKDGDIVLFSRVMSEYKTGDVVFIEKTEDAREDYFKRIVGLPGQTVDIDESIGVVLIDGEPLMEPYIYAKTEKTGDIEYPITLDADEYFVMGDNRKNSKDSRLFGPVKEKEIDGKGFFTVRIFN